MEFFILDIHHLNRGWMYRNYGTLITSNGNVCRYSFSSRRDNYSLENKLTHAVLIKHISPSTVRLLHGLLTLSLNIQSVNLGLVEYDQGLVIHTGYLFTNKGIKKIELSQRGDFTKYNANKYALELVKHIDKISS